MEESISCIEFYCKSCDWGFCVPDFLCEEKSDYKCCKCNNMASKLDIQSGISTLICTNEDSV